MLKILGLVIWTLLPCIRTEQILDTFDLQRMYIEFSELTKRVSELELRDKILSKENEELKARIVVLESTTLRQQEKLELRDKILSKENEELKARIEVLESTTQHQQEELDQLKNIQSDSIGSESTSEDIPIKSSTRRSTLTTINGQAISQYKGISRIKKAENVTTVAFFSKLAAIIRNPGLHHQIVFEQVVTNVGNCYNRFSGDFRSPVRGVYVFSTTLMASNPSYQYYFQYMKNGNAVSNIYIIEHGGTTSQDMVLELQPGDTVAIRTSDTGHDIYGYGHSTFSGFLLQQIYDNPAVVGK